MSTGVGCHFLLQGVFLTFTSALKSFLPASDPLHREGCPCTNPEKPKLKKMHARSVDSVALHNSQATERPPRRVGAAAGTRATGAAGVA